MRRDAVAGIVVVLVVDDRVRPIGMGDVPTDRHPVETLRTVKTRVIEDTACHELTADIRVEPHQLSRLPQLVVTVCEQWQFGSLRNILQSEDVDFTGRDRAEIKEEQVNLRYGWLRCLHYDILIHKTQEYRNSNPR